MVMHFASKVISVSFSPFWTANASEAEKLDVEALLDSLDQKIEQSSSTTPNCITSKVYVTWYGCAFPF